MACGREPGFGCWLAPCAVAVPVPTSHPKHTHQQVHNHACMTTQEERMQKAVSVVADNFNTMRTGRANPAILDRITVSSVWRFKPPDCIL